MNLQCQKQNIITIIYALCRLMMAYATKKSDDFDYGTFVDTNNWAA